MNNICFTLPDVENEFNSLFKAWGLNEWHNKACTCTWEYTCCPLFLVDINLCWFWE